MIEVGTGLLTWILQDPVRSLIFFILLFCAFVILSFKKDIKSQVSKLVSAINSNQTHLDSFEENVSKSVKECKASLIEISSSVMAMNLTLDRSVKEISAHKSDIIKALLENKTEVRQSTETFSRAIGKLTEVRKEVDTNMGRILQVDEKLKTLVERNKK